ncbi:putative bifunctional diguanylate cyclase/phosphodiesterase [Marinobacter sp.]|uniref:putative bifunctional diguanylate cyclase/phosphodiesterase n=1 Tax=Marinobacter sp. TaxID=50741 RepID=UPI0034A24CA7
MRLAEFIRTHRNEILQIWEQDAEEIIPYEYRLTRVEVRDHVDQILLKIAGEVEKRQADVQRVIHIDDTPSGNDIPAQLHGVERHDLGIDIVDVATEFSAMRTAVVQLWTRDSAPTNPLDLNDLMRFHKEVDRALAESIDQYARRKERQGRLFETMLSSLPDPCYILSLEGRFIYANDAMANMCGLPPDDVIGRMFCELPLPANYNGREQLCEVIHRKTQREGEVEISTPAGEKRCFEYVYVPALDDNEEVEAVSGIAHDVTSRKASEAESWQHANFDILTNVPNRRLFRDRLEQHAAHSLRTGDPFALLFIDLDRFKEINDRLGHDAGDDLLKEVATRISACVRQSDTVARIGGDEFTVILLDTGNMDLIENIAGAILEELTKPFQLGDEEVTISGSIGVTLFPEDATTPQQLLSNADQAMYYAKYSGRNQIFLYTDVAQRSRTDRQLMISELRAAPTSDQLRLYYQPIIDLTDGRIAKAEVLLRWQHPRRGLLLPADFLGLAEETGIMCSLENWVFAQAALSTDQWSALAGDEAFQITINTSPLQFMHGNSKPWEPHLETFAKSGTEIAVELTENVFLHDSKNLSSRFAELQDAGIQLALDDFGTGYSSLAYLKRFDVNYLKIDQSFVRGSGISNSSGQTIAETIIVMAHKLGLKVVAEGVETAEQRDWLVAAGCDYGQGFYFSKPLPADAFSQLLGNGYVTH